MASEPEENHGDPDDYEEGGGPVKSFLEHLEDLRWTLIKSVVSLLVGMLVCMIGAPYLVAVLVWPLEHSWIVRSRGTNDLIVVHAGHQLLGEAITRAGTVS